MRYLFLLILLSCTNKEVQPTKEVEPSTPVQASTSTAPSVDCNWIETSRVTIKDKSIDENSGMVWFDNTLYIINDSNGYSGYFACAYPYTDCKKIAVNIKNDDFEGMAKYKDQVVIADSGNNWSKNPINITSCTHGTSDCVSHKARFPDGGRDVETFMIDPLTGNEYFVSKLYNGKDPSVYKLAKGETQMNLVGVYHYNLVSGHNMKVLSDGAFNPNGKSFIMTEIDGKGTTVMVECKFNLSDIQTQAMLDYNVSNHCKTFKVKSLGQIESLAFIDENTFVYSSEGTNAPLVTMVCK